MSTVEIVLRLAAPLLALVVLAGGAALLSVMDRPRHTARGVCRLRKRLFVLLFILGGLYCGSYAAFSLGGRYQLTATDFTETWFWAERQWRPAGMRWRQQLLVGVDVPRWTGPGLQPQSILDHDRLGDLFAPLITIDRWLWHPSIVPIPKRSTSGFSSVFLPTSDAPKSFTPQRIELHPQIQTTTIGQYQIYLRNHFDFAFNLKKQEVTIRSAETSLFHAKAYRFHPVHPDHPGFRSFDAQEWPVDLTNDGTREIILQSTTGGHHGYYSYWILSLNRDQPRLLAYFNLGTQPLEITDLDNDRRYELIISDDTFVYWKTCYVGSPAPPVILQWAGEEYVLATLRLWKHVVWLQERMKRTHAELCSNRNPWVLAARAGKLDERQKHWRGKLKLLPPPNLWGQMLDFIYIGDGARARKLYDAFWPDDLDGKRAFLREFDATLRGSPYYAKIEQATPPAKRWPPVR